MSGYPLSLVGSNQQQAYSENLATGSLQRTNGNLPVSNKDPKKSQLNGGENGQFVELKFLGGRKIAKPTPKELEAAKSISRAARKEGNKLRIGMAILGVLGAIASVAAAIFTGGLALIGLAVAALVVGGGVVAGNRRESGTQAAYAQTEQDQRNTFQLDGNQTAAERFQDVQTYMKMEAAQRKAEKKAAKENFDPAKFSKGLNEAWAKKVPNSTDQPTAPTLQEIQNARQNLGSSMRGIPQQPASMPESSPLAPKPEQKNTQPPAPGSQRIPQRRGSPIPGAPQGWSRPVSMPRSSTNAKDEAIQHMTAGVTSIASGEASLKTMGIATSTTAPKGTPVSTPTTSAKPSDTATAEASEMGSVADKGTTEIKPKFSNETLATLDNIATFLEKDKADITEEEFVETLQFGSTEVRDVYTAAKDQGLLTKDLLSKLVNKQKECYLDPESGTGSLIEQINTFKATCSEQKISSEAIDAVFKEVERLKQEFLGNILDKTRKDALSKLDEAGGIKGANGEVLISGDTLKTIFEEAVKLKNTATGNNTSQIKLKIDDLKELTDELKINTLILSEESGSAEGIERLNDATLNITSREGDPQQITLSVRDSKAFYKTTPDGEEKELDEAGKKHIQNALVFNGELEHEDGFTDSLVVTPSTLETKQNLLSDIEKASAKPAETAAKPTHKDDTIGDDDDEIGSGDLTESTASKDASEVAAKSMDATEDELSFDELVSQAEGKQLITEYGTSKFVSLKNLDIKNFEDIAEDGSNLPAESRPMYLAYRNQRKKFGNEEPFFGNYLAFIDHKEKKPMDNDTLCAFMRDFQDACESANISSEDRENIWKVVWASEFEDIFEPTDDEIDATVDVIVKGNVGCEDKAQLKGIVKSAIAIRVELANIEANSYPDEIVAGFAINCECSTLKLGEDEDNPIDGAKLYIGNDKDEKYIDDDGNAVPISIEYDEDGKFYFKYSLNGTKHTVKEGNDEYETLKQALHDAFVFGPVGEEGDVMPLQEKLNVDEKLAIFTGKNKKATDTTPTDTAKASTKPDNDDDDDDEKIDDTSDDKATKAADEPAEAAASAAAPAPAEPLDPVAAAAAKVNIAIQKSDSHWEYQNIHPLQPEDISNIKNFERKIGDPNTPASITILLKKGIERQEENIKANAEELGWDISKFNISDSQKLEAAKYLQDRHYEKVNQAKIKFEDACAKIGFTTDGQKNFMCQMMQAQLPPSSASKLYNDLSKQIGFKEMNQENLKKACEAVESLHRVVAYSDTASSEDLKGLSTIIGPIVSMRPVYSDKNLEEFETNVFVNGNHFQNCKIEYKTEIKNNGGMFHDQGTYDIPTEVSYIDPTTKEEKKYELYTVLQITQRLEGSDRFDLWCNDEARK